MIAIEGFDNAGKSTLAKVFGYPVIHPGPRPSDPREANGFMKMQLAMASSLIVMDRLTCVSTMAYASHAGEMYEYFLQKMLEQPQFVIVYCRPPIDVMLDFNNHVKKEYDSDEYIKRLIHTGRSVIGRYDKIMRRTPHLSYDYTKDDVEALIAKVLRKINA